MSILGSIFGHTYVKKPIKQSPRVGRKEHELFKALDEVDKAVDKLTKEIEDTRNGSSDPSDSITRPCNK